MTFPCLPLPDPLPKLHKKKIQIPIYPVPYTCDYGCCIILWALSPLQKPDPSCLQFVIYTHTYPHGVSLIYDLAYDSGMLQSELFTSRSQNLVSGKLQK